MTKLAKLETRIKKLEAAIHCLAKAIAMPGSTTRRIIEIEVDQILGTVRDQHSEEIGRQG